MEQKKINLSLLFSLIIFAIGICIKGLATFLGGAFGVPFVATLVMFALVLVFGLSSTNVRKRIVDVLIFDIIVVVFSLTLYCMVDWSHNPSADLIEFAQLWMNTYSVFSLLFFAWTLFRFLCEKIGKKVKFVEIVLGFEKYERKPKAEKQKTAKVKETKNKDIQDKPLKEVMNGDLEDKPLNEERLNQASVESKTEIVEANDQNDANNANNTNVNNQ